MAARGISKGIQKIFVGNLPWTVSSIELKKHFSQFGHIMHARVIFNRDTGMSKHYGFLELADRQVFEAIINQQHHKLEGKTLNVSPTDL